MKSGLEDRNNLPAKAYYANSYDQVSMKSGLEDRNNVALLESVANGVELSQ